MALSGFTPTFSRRERYEIILTPKFAVCWEVDHNGTRCIVNILEKYDTVLDLPNKSIPSGWRGRHIGWMAHPNAVIVRDDRFSDDPMHVV